MNCSSAFMNWSFATMWHAWPSGRTSTCVFLPRSFARRSTMPALSGVDSLPFTSMTGLSLILWSRSMLSVCSNTVWMLSSAVFSWFHVCHLGICFGSAPGGTRPFMFRKPIRSSSVARAYRLGSADLIP